MNVGSWTGIDTRKMAEQAGCLDLHRFSYIPFSAATHSMWNHVRRYNLELCENPLHRYHRVPCDPVLPEDPDYLYRAAVYLDKALRLFDQKIGLTVQSPSSLTVLEQELTAFSASEAPDQKPPAESRPSTESQRGLLQNGHA